MRRIFNIYQHINFIGKTNCVIILMFTINLVVKSGITLKADEKYWERVFTGSDGRG